MDVLDAIRSRRTHKAFDPEPLDAPTVRELLELARWAPNHHLTEPWEFRVVGPQALDRLKDAAGPEQAPKLDRAPTLIAATARRDPGDLGAEQEDLLAVGCAVYAVLLAAEARGLAGYWRTPEVLRGPAGRAALGIGDDEHVVGLIHLGRARGTRKPAPARSDVDEYTRFLA